MDKWSSQYTATSYVTLKEAAPQRSKMEIGPVFEGRCSGLREVAFPNSYQESVKVLRRQGYCWSLPHKEDQAINCLFKNRYI